MKSAQTHGSTASMKLLGLKGKLQNKSRPWMISMVLREHYFADKLEKAIFRLLSQKRQVSVASLLKTIPVYKIQTLWPASKITKTQ